MKVRPATNADRDAIWKIFHEVVASGDTYPLDPNISRKDALAYWFQPAAHAYVAELDGLKPSSFHSGEIVGSYTLHSNQSGGGGHVANAAFIVPKDARGQGIGRAMGLWQSLGMKIIGTLPGAFRHPEQGYVDVYVMFQSFEQA